MDDMDLGSASASGSENQDISDNEEQTEHEMVINN